MNKNYKQNKLSQEEISRYSRHIILEEVGLEGQKKIKDSKILVVGTGGLGSPVILYLAAAGIGTIGIIDFDIVDESNLQRQILHTTIDIGQTKTSSAKNKINAINPNVNVIEYNDKLVSQNALEIIKDFDIVIDGTDNFQSRYLINDACVILNKPFVYGSIFKFEGQVSVFNLLNGPCYRCLYPTPPAPGLVPSCSEAGVIGVLPGIIGTIQANEALKIILNIGEILSSKLLTFDALKMEFKKLKLKKDENCPVCSTKKTITKLIDYEEFCGLKKNNKKINEILAHELKELIKNKEDIQIIDVRSSFDFNLNKIKNSKNIPFNELSNRANEIDINVKTIIVCKVGFLSKEAILELNKTKAIDNVYSLKGGISSWSN